MYLRFVFNVLVFIEVFSRIIASHSPIPHTPSKPEQTVVCNQSSNYAKTLKSEYSAAISLLWNET